MASERVVRLCISGAERTVRQWRRRWIDCAKHLGVENMLRGAINAENKLGVGVEKAVFGQAFKVKIELANQLTVVQAGQRHIADMGLVGIKINLQ